MLLLAVVCLMATAACSDGGSADNSEAGLKAAVKGFANGLYQGDYKTAYLAFAKACRDRTPFPAFTRAIEAAKPGFEAELNIKIGDVEVKDVLVRNFADKRAEAALVTGVKGRSDLDNTSAFDPWAIEDGSWRFSECMGMPGRGSTD